MKINTVYVGNGREILQIDDARIIYRNFSGEGSRYNREGDRNFSVVIPDEDIANELTARGWKIKIKPPKDPDDTPFMYMPVKIKFNDRGPKVYLESGAHKRVQLDMDSVDCLDDIDISSVDMDIRPYDWDVNGKSGRTAYLQAIRVVQNVSRFEQRFAEEEYPEE